MCLFDSVLIRVVWKCRLGFMVVGLGFVGIVRSLVFVLIVVLGMICCVESLCSVVFFNCVLVW